MGSGSKFAHHSVHPTLAAGPREMSHLLATFQGHLENPVRFCELCTRRVSGVSDCRRSLYPSAPTPSELCSDHQESILIIGDGALAATLLCPFMVLILQMEKLRLREVKLLVQGTQQAINDAQGGIPCLSSSTASLLSCLSHT